MSIAPEKIGDLKDLFESEMVRYLKYGLITSMAASFLNFSN